VHEIGTQAFGRKRPFRAILGVKCTNLMLSEVDRVGVCHW